MSTTAYSRIGQILIWLPLSLGLAMMTRANGCLAQDAPLPENVLRFAERVGSHEQAGGISCEFGPGKATAILRRRQNEGESPIASTFSYTGSSALGLAGGRQTTCLIYSSDDADGVYKTLAIEVLSNGKEIRGRVLLGSEELKGDWTKVDGSFAVRLTKEERLESIVGTKVVDKTIFRQENVVNLDDRLFLEAEYWSLREDIRRIFGEDLQMCWYEEDGKTRFALPNSGVGKTVARLLSLEDEGLLNETTQRKSISLTVAITGQFAAHYRDSEKFHFEHIAGLLENRLAEPDERLAKALAMVSKPRRRSIDLRRENGMVVPIRLLTSPIQFLETSDGRYRYYWRTRIDCSEAAKGTLQIHMDTQLGTRHRTQSPEQTLWKHRSVHSLTSRNGIQDGIETGVVNTKRKVAENQSNRETVKLITSEESLPELFDDLEIAFLAGVRDTLLGQK